MLDWTVETQSIGKFCGFPLIWGGFPRLNGRTDLTQENMESRAEERLESASFRDPGGSLVAHEGRIFRIINATGAADLRAFLEAPCRNQLSTEGRVVATEILTERDRAQLLETASVQALYASVSGEMVLEHEKIAFPSFPYEWAPEMLYAAAELTLELAKALLADNLGLKDATPYNVLFRGPSPVFIDVLSFERRDPGDATWLPYAQFVRTFLLPLLANKFYGVGLDQIFLSRRDGLEPEEVYRWASAAQRLRSPFLSLVSLPSWLGKRHNQDDQSVYRKKLQDPERAQFILRALLKGLSRTLAKLRPASGKHSVWSDYMTANNNYTEAHFAAKQKFVQRMVAEVAPKRVLDVGCNTGFFSSLAARAGASVVAIDYDPVVVGDVWRGARDAKLDILPLVVNLTRPSPGSGWRNAECAPFLDRARGKFDGVLMLAVVHHMLVTERIPLPEIIRLAAEITTDLAIIEFIGPADSMFMRLTRGRDELHKDLTPEVFEKTCEPYFEITSTEHQEGTSRWLYALRKRR
jgi:SAM-dependent methyltransferase